MDLDDQREANHEAADVTQLAAQAWARAAAAVRTGRLRDAQGWTRLWRDLSAAAEAEARARAAEAAAVEVHSVHSVHSVSLHAADLTGVETAEADSADSVSGLSEADRTGGGPAQVHSVHSVHPVCEAPPPLRPIERPAGAPVSLVGPFGGRVAPPDKRRVRDGPPPR